MDANFWHRYRRYEIAARLAERAELRRVLDVIARGAEDDEAPPDDRLLPASFFAPVAPEAAS